MSDDPDIIRLGERPRDRIFVRIDGRWHQRPRRGIDRLVHAPAMSDALDEIRRLRNPDLPTEELTP